MDWYLATNQEILKDSWFPRHDHKDGEVVQIQASGPDEEVESATLLLGTALACACRRVLICTPYLVPGQSVLNALQAAALRGVEVHLLVPHRSDHQIVTLAGRSYYQDLLTCGAHIHEYLPGVDHSKVVAIDDELVIVSSANMDIRSYTSSFEVSAIVYSESLARQAARDFKAQLKDSKEITPRDFAERSVTERLKENGARLLSPFL
jgi:cardiolipin synthase